MSATFAERFAETADGLKLFYRDYAAAKPGLTPVVCLPGLSRCHRDFGPIAEILAPSRRVICPDMRGRGRSDRDKDFLNYNVLTETQDVLGLLDGLGVTRAAFIGASRGGILTMLISQIRPTLVAAAVLNDIGPVIEKRGLVRIVATLGLTPEHFRSWDEAARMVRQANERQFPHLSDAEWMAFARRLYTDEDGAPRLDYDWRLTSATQAALEDAPPVLWAQFERLEGIPTLAIRGENSDILSAETLAEMKRRMPALETMTLRDRGHTPFLDEPEAVAAITALLERVDRWKPITPPCEPLPPG